MGWNDGAWNQGSWNQDDGAPADSGGGGWNSGSWNDGTWNGGSPTSGLEMAASATMTMGGARRRGGSVTIEASAAVLLRTVNEVGGRFTMTGGSTFGMGSGRRRGGAAVLASEAALQMAGDTLTLVPGSFAFEPQGHLTLRGGRYRRSGSVRLRGRGYMAMVATKGSRVAHAARDEVVIESA